MDKIFNMLKNLDNGDILILITPFIPAPILDISKNKNHKTYTRKIKEEEFENFILK